MIDDIFWRPRWSRSIDLSLDGGGKDVSFCVLDCSVKKQVVLIVVRPSGGIG